MLRLPSADAVVRMVSNLVGTKLTIVQQTVDDSALTICGLYSSGDTQNAAACLMDVPFGAYAGAALSMMPSDVASEYVKKGKLEEDILDNCAEVLNVVSRLFASSDAHRVTLATKSFGPDPLPDVAATLLAKGSRLALKLNIERYGAGSIVLVVPA
ncbi:hypothetical protein [Plasticicumulans acidivorans]|uniref:Chemotaxis phosphatase CheX-like domain-containing protein n=1 Tax=Plasticicumulans acidivorans TaxID=886464 RepID=A0A317MWK7_9GAMM|nr:hypothetical protein [Plasticicumulans acidivorans]PWV63249.1 hypothetical protein C7443_103174 [Plasticicumulans acidivorans]